MVFCPECNLELKGKPSICYLCGEKLTGEDGTGWVVLGTVETKMYGDFARETLKSYDIPVVVISKSGFFGNVGLPLNPFYRIGTALFEISVPAVQREEAAKVLDMTLGDKWQRKE